MCVPTKLPNAYEGFREFLLRIFLPHSLRSEVRAWSFTMASLIQEARCQAPTPAGEPHGPLEARSCPNQNIGECTWRFIHVAHREMVNNSEIMR